MGSRSSTLKAASWIGVGEANKVKRWFACRDTRMVLRVSVPRWSIRSAKRMTGSPSALRLMASSSWPASTARGKRPAMRVVPWRPRCRCRGTATAPVPAANATRRGRPACTGRHAPARDRGSSGGWDGCLDRPSSDSGTPPSRARSAARPERDPCRPAPSGPHRVARPAPRYGSRRSRPDGPLQRFSRHHAGS